MWAPCPQLPRTTLPRAYGADCIGMVPTETQVLLGSDQQLLLTRLFAGPGKKVLGLRAVPGSASTSYHTITRTYPDR